MKKLVSVFFCALMVVTLSACSNNEDNVVDESSIKTSETQGTLEVTQPIESEEIGYFSDFTDEDLISLASKEFEETKKVLNVFVFGGFPVVYDDSIEAQGNYYVRVKTDFAENKEYLKNYLLEYITEEYAKEENFLDFIDNMFLEFEGKLYVMDGSKGGDPAYEGYEISKIMNMDGDNVNFKIDYKYVDPETREIEEVKSYDFGLVYEDGKIKVSDLTWPD